MDHKDKVIKKCRLCFSSKLEKVNDFGKVALGNNLHKNYKDAIKAKSYPLCLVRCIQCNHFQLNFSVNPINLYAKNYTYTSSIGASFVTHLKKSADDILDYCEKIKETHKVIDIGSNDGTALLPFKDRGNLVLGVDPAKTPSEMANKKKIKTINNFFSKRLSDEILAKYGYFDIVISHNVLAHIEDIHDVFNGINNILKEGGLLVFEIGYFRSLIENTIFDTIYHEHLDYHTKKPLVKFLTKKGFSIEQIKENNVQGGSLRFYCKKIDNLQVSQELKTQLQNETDYLNRKRIENWRNQIYVNIDNIKSMIVSTINLGGNIYGFGAPTKATLILKMFGHLSDNIKLIVDDNHLKVNKYTSTSAIKISSHFPKNMSNKDMIICFAWNFYDEIFNKLKDTDAKGYFINVNTAERRIL